MRREHTAPCLACDATGWTFGDDEDCPRCAGRGVVEDPIVEHADYPPDVRGRVVPVAWGEQ